MVTSQQAFGQKAESIAVRQLKKAGYKIITRNYRNRIGEIDIVARDGKTLVFVEVKARKTLRYGHPKHALTRAKQRRVSMVALEYLKSTGQSSAKARFDVVAISAPALEPRIEIIKNAFELAYP
jgi:putative endonuclease